MTFVSLHAHVSQGEMLRFLLICVVKKDETQTGDQEHSHECYQIVSDGCEVKNTASEQHPEGKNGAKSR